MKKISYILVLILTMIVAASCSTEQKYELPDLTGMNEQAVKDTLNRTLIEYEIKRETNIEFDDNEFIRYEGFKIGQKVKATQTVVIIIAQNEGMLPILKGLNKAQIIEKLEKKDYYNYSFVYVVDDEKEHDLFSAYVNHELGQVVETTEEIVIELYQNTFLNKETSLFISKYIDAGYKTSNQGIEIYNGTNVAVDLKDYYLAVLHNGELAPSKTIEFEDIQLMSGQTYVIVNKASSDRTLRSKANILSEDLYFDGNDVIQLRYKNHTYIDTFYNLGNRQFIYEEEMQVRDTSVKKGNRSFNTLEWIGYVGYYFEAVGTYPLEVEERPIFIHNSLPFGNEDGMDLVELISVTDGDTASFYGTVSGKSYSGKERVRFLGIDTPETHPIVEFSGLEAKDYTNQQLNNAKIIYLQSSPFDGTVDTYGRTLALIWIDGKLLNYDLVLNGHSQNYLPKKSKLVFQNRYLYQWFADAEEYAKANKLGLWAEQ